MRSAVFAVLVATAAQGTSAWSEADTKEVAIGLLEGFVFDGTEFKQCIKDAKFEIKDIEDAVKDLEKKDATDVMKGLRKLGEALKEFPDTLHSCKDTEQDVAKLVSALSQISKPEHFLFHVGKNLIVNHHDIYSEVETAVNDFKTKKYEDFGLQVGEALRKLVVGNEGRFHEFLKFHNKTYASIKEFEHRMEVFAKNHLHIYHVQRNELGSAKYSYMSPFADLTPEEFATMNGFRYTPDELLGAPMAEMLPVSGLPDNLDWRAKGAVNPVKNQAMCGSCWAFATVANIEGAGFVETGKLVSLSEQELVDCDKQDHGCQGGLPSLAYKNMISNKMGLETESAYPYKSRGGQCNMASSKEVSFISAWQQIPSDEDQMAAATVKYGPLAIGINAGPMQWYHSGVAHPWKLLCNPKKIDHGVAIVGFGVENSKKYWTIRNSWGSTWGEKGYYRIVRGVNACGLTSMVTTATGIKINSPSDRTIVV